MSDRFIVCATNLSDVDIYSRIWVNHVSIKHIIGYQCLCQYIKPTYTLTTRLKYLAYS